MWRHCNHCQCHASAEAQPYTAAAIFRAVTNAHAIAHTRSGAHANAYSADVDATHQFTSRATCTGAATASFIRMSHDHLQSQ